MERKYIHRLYEYLARFIVVHDGYNFIFPQIYLPVRQTTKISMRPGSRFPSIGIERASIAQDTVANVVATVIVCSVLKDINTICMEVCYFLYTNKIHIFNSTAQNWFMLL